MMIEKLEECPQCGRKDRWHYDTQRCEHCQENGFGHKAESALRDLTLPKSLTDLSSLIERCKAATGPDRELDYAIRWIARPLLQRRPMIEIIEELRKAENTGFTPAYTSSIDAIVALIHDHKHPHGRKCICSFNAGGQLIPDQANPDDIDYHPRALSNNSVTVGWMAHVAFFEPGSSQTYGPDGYCHARTPALAMCTAFLAALSVLPHGAATP